MIRAFLKRRITDPLTGFIKQGISSSHLALGISLGITLALIPVFGASTLLCLALIWMFKLNPAVVLLANQLAYPLQFVLYFSFIRTGEWMFNAQPIPLSITEIFHLFEENIIHAMGVLWWSTLYGIVAWVIISIPITYFLFLFFRIIFFKIEARVNAVAPE